jgi:hypothetical protein
MVIKITLGFAAGFVTALVTWDWVLSDRVACAGLGAAFCAKAVVPAAGVITTANESGKKQRADESAERKIEKRANMRLFRRRLLLRAPRLLVCFRRESLGGQSLG